MNNELIRAIIADDVEDTLHAMCNRINSIAPHIQIMGRYTSIAETIKAIWQSTPDVLITDIRFVPEAKTVFDLLDVFKHSKEIDFSVIIFTGHYNEVEYLQKSYNYPNTVHFLPKPIDNEMLKDAIARLSTRSTTSNVTQNTIRDSKSENMIIIATSKGDFFVNLDDIVYISYVDKYTLFHLHRYNSAPEIICSSKNIGFWAESLTNYSNLFRIHASAIINTDYMSGVGKSLCREVILKPPYGTIRASKEGFKRLKEFLKNS